MLSSSSLYTDFSINLFEVGLLVYFLHQFFKFRYNQPAFIAFSVFLQAVVLLIINLLFPSASAASIGFVILTGALLNYWIFNGKFLRILPPLLVWIVLLGLTEGLVLVCFSLGIGVPASVLIEEPTQKILLALLTRGILLLVSKKAYKLLIVSRELKKIYLLEISVILILNIAIVLVFPKTLLVSTPVKTSNLVIIIVVLVASFSILKLFNGIMQFASREAEYELQLQYISNMHDFIHRLRAQRHDFNHHLGCIYGLLEDDQFNEAKSYTEQLIYRTDELNNLLKTNNPYVTAILNHKLSVAKQKDINLDVDVDIPSKLVIEPADLSIIIGNILDNAIEACEKVEGYKYIKISIYEKLSYLIIFVKNSAKEPKGDTKSLRLKTSKDDKDNHGFGIKNINYVVEKNSGKCEMSYADGEFTVNILLNNLK